MFIFVTDLDFFTFSLQSFWSFCFQFSLFRMLRLNVVLLAFLVSSLLMTGEAGRQRRATSSKERKNVAKLGPEGKNCLAGGKLVCHKDIKTKFSSTLAV